MALFDTAVENLAKAKLDKESRDALPDSDFVFPSERRYPIQDKAHALAALSYSSGTKDEGVVRAAVTKRYPDINLSKAVMIDADLGGAGEASLSIEQGKTACPECGGEDGKHKKDCPLKGTNPSGKEVVMTKEGTPADKTKEPFSSSTTSNWVARAGGLPNYIQHVAHALVRKGMPESQAIATAINTMKRWARGGGNVSASVSAAASKALAELKAKGASSKLKKALEDDTEPDPFDPDLVWAMEEAGRIAERGALRKSLFTGGITEDFENLLEFEEPAEEEPEDDPLRKSLEDIMAKRFDPRQPRDPATGEWISIGGVSGPESHSAHTHVGGVMQTYFPSGSKGSKVALKVKAGEKLSRGDRKILADHVRERESASGDRVLSPTGVKHYRNMAKVQGISLSKRQGFKVDPKAKEMHDNYNRVQELIGQGKTYDEAHKIVHGGVVDKKLHALSEKHSTKLRGMTIAGLHELAAGGNTDAQAELDRRNGKESPRLKVGTREKRPNFRSAKAARKTARPKADAPVGATDARNLTREQKLANYEEMHGKMPNVSVVSMQALKEALKNDGQASRVTHGFIPRGSTARRYGPNARTMKALVDKGLVDEDGKLTAAGRMIAERKAF